jgi:hypothetical protein
VLEIPERLCGPQLLAQLFATDYLTGALYQGCQDLEGLRARL